MMEREWRSLLAMYGQEVTLRLEGMEDRPLRAFLQPVRGSNASLLPWASVRRTGIYI